MSSTGRRGSRVQGRETLNIANILRYFWTIVMEENLQWVNWVKSVLLKGKSILQIRIPTTATWSWRNILKLRPIAYELMKWKVGGGQNIFLWYDAMIIAR